MKDIRPAIRSLLLADATVNGMVGGNRIYPIRLPQGQRLLSIVYNRVTERAEMDMAGWAGFGNAQMQIDSWADNPDSSTQLADAIFDVMTGFKGDIAYGSNSPQSAVTVGGIMFVAGREDYDNEAQLFRMSRDYMVWFYQR